MATSLATTQYEHAARMKFDALVTNYNATNASWWQLGNSFDAMIDFLDTFSYGTTDKLADQVKDQYAAGLSNLNGGYDGAWFDDLGWWIVAAQRAVKRPYFKKDIEWFRNIVKECWSRFTGNAPLVWERHKPGTYTEYRPAVEGGVWNEYWAGTPVQYKGPKDGDPSHAPVNGVVYTLHGIQNTVTNAVYLIAAQRGEGTSFEAEREFRFLYRWLFEEKQNPLWWQPDPVKASNAYLVRERASHFYSGNPDTAFQTDWAWTGDLGLMLGGFTDRIRQKPGERGVLVNRAKQMLTGARDLLSYEKGVLQPWSESGSAPDGDTPDYSTGTGVFWRNVLYAWRADSELRAFLSAAYPQFLKLNADNAALRTTDDVIELTNDVAVLVAATVMLN